MIAVFHKLRKAAHLFALGAAALVLAACEPGPMTGPGGPRTDPGAPVTVALLVPGASGQATDAILARSIENAARLAIADLQGVAINLRVYQTNGQPASAAAAANQAVVDGAQILLGPVFAQEANAAGAAVAAAGINVLSLSNNSAVAGGNVFVLGQTFDNTAERLARYSARQGQRNVMILNDRTAAGDAGRAAITSAVNAAGGRVVGSFAYEFSQNGIAQAVPQIVAATRANGANALFMTADSAGALPLLSQLLRDNGISPATQRFIGLTRWDIPRNTLSLPGVQGGWFALPDPALYARFESRYTAAYGEPPHPIAAAPAYDGIAAIGALVRAGRSDALSRAALTQTSGFVGVAGIFRLRQDGSSERALAVAEIRNGQIVIIDPAPRSFAGAGL